MTSQRLTRFAATVSTVLYMGAALQADEAAGNDSFGDVLKICAVSNTSYEQRRDAFLSVGWSILSQDNLKAAVAVIGDANLLSGKLREYPEGLALSRREKRASLGSRINRPTSTYFKSVTLRSDTSPTTYVNVFWQKMGNRTLCNAGALRGEHSSNPRTILADLPDNARTNDVGLVFYTRFRTPQETTAEGINLSSVSLFSLKSDQLNELLDPPLVGDTALTVLTINPPR